jgi:putative Flp pilus-assembly TadE/G-like protein
MLRTRSQNERGQTLVVFVLFLFVLMGAAAIVIDLGYWYVTKRQAQATADAVALAAAADLPDGAVAASDSSGYRTRNNWDGSVALSVSSVNTNSDTITAHATTTVPGFFAKVFGIDNVDVGATATARIGSYTGWALNLAPWTMTESDLKWGTDLDLKVVPGDQYAPGNFGAIDLIVPNKATCSQAHGANDYRDLIENTIQSCLVNIGDMLDLKTGNMAILDAALTARGAVNGLDPSSMISYAPNGDPQLTRTDDPNIVVIPIIDQFLNGSHPVQVVNFAYFVITSWTKSNVRGRFVKTGAPSGRECPTTPGGHQACPVGGYDPNGISVVQLVD